MTSAVTILTVPCLQSSRRRPVPLTLEQSPGDWSTYDRQLEDSTALQDAAVKSATSLIAVVNDMLKSPLASARLPPPEPSGLAPSHGRPRSRTAPSTPLVEAPARPPLVELPGSIPDRPRASYHHSFEGKLKTRLSRDPRHDQPCRSAKRPSHPWLEDTFNTNSERSIVNPVEEATHGDSHHHPQHSQRDSASNGSARMRASLPAASTAPRTRQSHVPETPTSWRGSISRESDPRLSHSDLNFTRRESQPLIEDHVEPSEDTKIPLSDIASLHASHEALMATTAETHRREVASLRMYITFLEQRQGVSRTNDAHAQTSVRPRSTLQADANVANRLDMKLAGKRTEAEGSHLPRQDTRHGHLDSADDPKCTSYAGYGELWLECNHLRESLDAYKRQVAHAEETISRLQRLELSLKNENGGLRSRLLAANNERLDVQEGFFEASRDLQRLAER